MSATMVAALTVSGCSMGAGCPNQVGERRIEVPAPDFTQNLSPAFSVGFRARLGAEWLKAYSHDMPVERAVGVSGYVMIAEKLTAIESNPARLDSVPLVGLSEDGTIKELGIAKPHKLPNAKACVDGIWHASLTGIKNGVWTVSDEIVRDTGSARISALLTIHFKMRALSDEFQGAFAPGEMTIILVCTNDPNSPETRKWGSLRCCILAETNTKRVLVFTKSDSEATLQSYMTLLQKCNLPR